MDPHHSRNDNQLINNALFSDVRASTCFASKAAPEDRGNIMPHLRLPTFPHIADRIGLVNRYVTTTAR
jgi:hypothetical protein